MCALRLNWQLAGLSPGRIPYGIANEHVLAASVSWSLPSRDVANRRVRGHVVLGYSDARSRGVSLVVFVLRGDVLVKCTPTITWESCARAVVGIVPDYF
jgi:hypothetical protein